MQFFIESELHEHGSYLVDSLIESNPMMKESAALSYPSFIPKFILSEIVFYFTGELVELGRWLISFS